MTANIDNQLIKLNINAKTYSIDPQDQVLKLLNHNLLLNKTGYSSNVKSVPSLVEAAPTGAGEYELFFEENKTVLTDACNTIVIASEYPFDLRIDDGDIILDLYSFSIVSENEFAVSVLNRSIENDIVLNYLAVSSTLLGSSYVHM
jgi:hypothetical protein